MRFAFRLLGCTALLSLAGCDAMLDLGRQFVRSFDDIGHALRGERRDDAPEGDPRPAAAPAEGEADGGVLDLAKSFFSDEAKPDAKKKPPVDYLTEFVTPPFPVKGNLEGLALTWFDGTGVYHATTRDGVPEAARGRVRLVSLSPKPGAKLPKDRVYVADLRRPLPDGTYPVQVVSRELFDLWADEARGLVAETDASRAKVAKKAAAQDAKAKSKRALAPRGSGPVVLYRTSWCGYCKRAEKFFRERGIDFVEKDIERNPVARTEMMAKLGLAGLPQTGAVPVIDLHGELMVGFDQPRIERLLQ